MLRVNGGPTGAGTVIKREAPPKTWRHECDTWSRKHPNMAPANVLQRYRVKTVYLNGYWARCPDCGEKRP